MDGVGRGRRDDEGVEMWREWRGGGSGVMAWGLGKVCSYRSREGEAVEEEVGGSEVELELARLEGVLEPLPSSLQPSAHTSPYISSRKLPRSPCLPKQPHLHLSVSLTLVLVTFRVVVQDSGNCIYI